MKGLDELFVVAWMLFGILLTPLFFIAFDFWAGTRKAKQRGEPLMSDKYKRTVDKVARYYNALLALVVVDCMQMAGIWYLDNYYDYHIPIFPFITLLGAFGVAAIEVKSIYEKAEDKERREMEQVATLVTEITKHRIESTEIARAVVEFLNKNKEEKE
ncbi:hypothetical protein [Bacteroides difficilis]|uniref:Phage holin family protein n=1 Tax=Bacteroides difficilis TaxID=2763021 RepID=A0ABR7CE99_9BACE|nr:hypothetical protein [Bacteroides difficilis]MBC5606129.1 hypothetical protein [Bacteroides difficilis]